MKFRFLQLTITVIFCPFLVLRAQLIDRSPAPVPVVPSIYNTEPWEDPLVSGINRDT